MLPSFTLGLDLGQTHDFSALVALERHEDSSGDPRRARYDVLMLERWRGRSYVEVPQLVARAETALRRLAADRVQAWDPWSACEITLVVDATGVGAGVTDLLEDAQLSPVRIIITAGVSVHRLDRGGFSVPKADLIAVVQLLLEGRRLAIAEDLPHAATLVHELQNFRYDYTASGHMRFGAGGDELIWRGDGAHDDLLLALAVAAWHAETQRPVGLDPAIVAAFHGLPR